MRGGVAFWLAPELIDCVGFQNSGRPTAASDVYAYACVCVEVSTTVIENLILLIRLSGLHKFATFRTCQGLSSLSDDYARTEARETLLVGRRANA